VSRSPLSHLTPARLSSRRVAAAAIGSVTLLGAVACGGSAPEHAGHDTATPSPSAAADAGGQAGGHGGHGGHGDAGVPAPALYAVQTGPLGVVLTDGSGRLVYRSAADSANPPTSHCVDACAETWIPITADPDQKLDLAGVKSDLVGRIQRPDGSTQLTLAGWPLYRNADDDGSLSTAGHNGQDGTWHVVTPTGGPATSP
jgi:predicted lipoprotein with Yx(FWY)xxD motif